MEHNRLEWVEDDFPVPGDYRVTEKVEPYWWIVYTTSADFTTLLFSLSHFARCCCWFKFYGSLLASRKVLRNKRNHRSRGGARQKQVVCLRSHKRLSACLAVDVGFSGKHFTISGHLSGGCVRCFHHCTQVTWGLSRGWKDPANAEQLERSQKASRLTPRILPRTNDIQPKTCQTNILGRAFGLSHQDSNLNSAFECLLPRTHY